MTKVTNISVLPDATQNFLEIYRKRQKKAGSSEKCLLGVSILLGILVILFFTLFLMVENDYNKLKKQKVCTSRDCLESAMTFLQTVDFSQDPCEDFYKFACGKFHVDHPIPENNIHNSWFVEKENRLIRLILDILKKPVSPEDIKSVRQTKEFFQACANKSELNSIGLKPLYDILELLELPRFVPNSETVQNFSLGKTLALAQRFLSQDILVGLSISRKTYNASEETNTKNSTILKISPGVQGISAFDVHKRNSDIYNEKRFYKFRRKSDFGYPRGSEKRTLQAVVLATVRFIAAILEEMSSDKHTDQDAPGNSSGPYTSTAYKIMTFSSELVKDFNTTVNDTEGNSAGEEQMTFSSLQLILEGEGSSNLSSNRIDWKEYVSTLFEKVNNTYDTDSEPIIVENLEYFKYLTRVLGEAKPETVQRHIWWKIIEQYAKYTTSNIRAIYFRYYLALYGESAPTSRNQVCANLVKDQMNVALSYEMAKINNFSASSLKVEEMLKDIGKAFEQIVKSVPWMDSQSKNITLDKANSLKNEIGFASWLMDGEKVEKYYEKLDLKKSEFLKNLMRVSEWEVQKILQMVGPDKENSTKPEGWHINPLQVNAYYSRYDNSIIIPAGILQTPFYFRGLESLNYGAIGAILGHELTHGFDIEGKNYNKFGERQENWWPHEITLKYESKSKCFIQQYENYTLYGDNKLNGTLTLAENIADNGGIRESYLAYQLFAKRNGYEEKLPGFENFTHEQLLFLSFANIWCDSSLPKYYQLSKDTHSPQRVRVLASLQNMNEFSKAYNCPKNSFMNPVNKCVICFQFEKCRGSLSSIIIDLYGKDIANKFVLYSFPRLPPGLLYE